MLRRTIFYTLLSLGLGQAAESPFVVEPHIQMGNAPALSSSGSMVILWHTADLDQSWDVQVKKPSDKRWSGPIAAGSTSWAVRGIDRHSVFHAGVTGLNKRDEFRYRVLR